jgi:hypothetical protein
MKFIQLTLHINAEEAETIIAFIDKLKSALLSNYSDEIKAQRTANVIINEGDNHDDC